MLKKPKSLQEMSARIGRSTPSIPQKRPRGAENIAPNPRPSRTVPLITKVQPASKAEQRKPPIPRASGSVAKKRLTPQELRERLAEVRTKNKDLIQELANSKTEIQSLNEAVKALEDRYTDLEASNTVLAKADIESKVFLAERDKQLSAMTTNISDLNRIIECGQKERDDLTNKISAGVQLIASLQQELLVKSTQMSAIQSLSESQSAAMSQLKQENQTCKHQIKELEEKGHADEALRKQLHNQVQELKGNIRVFCRVRPQLNGESPTLLSFPGIDSIEISGRNDVSFDGSSLSRRLHAFSFDRVFNPSSTQEDVWQEISQLCTSALDGYNVAVFAYGQTGSGKTFTMEGPSNSAAESLQGMIPRAIIQIFSCFDRMAERSWSFTCSASYVEIYNEQILDLLIVGGSTNEDDLKIKHRPDGSTEIVGAIVEVVGSVSDITPLLQRAAKNRSTARTKQNERSSRSHSVLQLTIRGYNTSCAQKTVGVLNLIDLAGSERLKRSESTGDTLKETQNINKSLSSLGDVISALSAKLKHVPYRNSKLTYLLQNCFGGESKCLMFVNISPEEENIAESLCSLRFASKVNACHIGTAKRSIKQQ